PGALDVGHARLTEARPADESEERRARLPATQNRVYDAAIQEHEVRPFRRQIEFGDVPHEPVVDACRERAAERLALPRTPHRQNALGAALPGTEEVRHVLRWVL